MAKCQSLLSGQSPKLFLKLCAVYENFYLGIVGTTNLLLYIYILIFKFIYIYSTNDSVHFSVLIDKIGSLY